jgi:glutamine amidotransferase PdxT
MKKTIQSSRIGVAGNANGHQFDSFAGKVEVTILRGEEQAPSAEFESRLL